MAPWAGKGESLRATRDRPDLALLTLAGRRAACFDQSLGRHLLEQFEQIALAAIRRDIIFFDQRISQLCNTSRLLKQIPDACADRIQSVIDGAIETQDG